MNNLIVTFYYLLLLTIFTYILRQGKILASAGTLSILKKTQVPEIHLL